MPEDPNFAELVVYHLTKETWSNRERYNAQRNENDYVMKRITAETSILDRMYLELLQEHEVFKLQNRKNSFEAGWKDWCRLERHRMCMDLYLLSGWGKIDQLCLGLQTTSSLHYF